MLGRVDVLSACGRGNGSGRVVVLGKRGALGSSGSRNKGLCRTDLVVRCEYVADS